MKEFLLAFVPLLIAVDPVGILPVSIGLTESLGIPGTVTRCCLTGRARGALVSYGAT